MLKRLIMTLIFLLCSPHFSIASTWNIPSIPSSNSNQKEIMLFETVNVPNKAEIINIMKMYTSLQLRFLYTETFHGFSVKGKKSELDHLSHAYQPISSNYDNKVYAVESSENTSVPFIGAEKVRGFKDSAGNPLTGKGIKVGIIDTGIDYKHPDLARNYTGGFDFVQNDQDPMETLVSEGEPTIHGTHVAGVVGANGRMQGVAPDAKLIAYRVLGPGGTGTTEQVLAAIEKAVKDKVDVINLSLGSEVNGPDLPISIALNKAVEKGIVAVTSNGNSGPQKWTVGSPGTSSKAISVGASTPKLKVPYISAVQISKPIKLNPLMGSKEWDLQHSYPIVNGGFGFLDELKNVSGKIVLIKRGKIEFSKKVKNAEKKGAIGVIIYNNTNGDFQGKVTENTLLPSASISGEIGGKLNKLISDKSLLITTTYKEEEDLLADFSSRGPVTVNWEIKPDVTAPGVAINSTIPGRSYLELQGTSMAAPHVAGAAAIIKQAHPEWSPEEIKASIMNTSIPLENEDGVRYATYEQGSGRLDIKSAIASETLVIPSSISLGKLYEQSVSRKKEIVVKNKSNEVKHYRFSIPKDQYNLEWKLPLPFTVEPGSEKKLIIEVAIKRPFNDQKEMVDGYLSLIEGSKKFEIPYLLIKGEPTYPRIMGFSIVDGDKPNTKRYEAYLPTGADEFGIALFDPESLKFLGFLDAMKNIGPGLREKEIMLSNIPNIRKVVAVAFAREDGREDFQSQPIFLKKEDD